MGPWPVLALRILLVGVERVLLRALGAGRPAAESAAVFFGVAALLLTPFAAPWAVHDWALLRLAVPSGIVYAAAYWLYVSALSGGDVSAIGPLGSLAGVFVVLLAFVVHREPLGPAKLAGAAAITASAALLQKPAAGGTATRPRMRSGRREPLGRDHVAAHPSPHAAPRPTRARPAAGLAHPAWQMAGYALLTAATRMLDKAAAGGGPDRAALYAWVVFTIVALGQCALLAATGGLGGLVGLLRRRPAQALAAGVCNGGSFLLLVVAMGALPVSVAEPVTALSLLVSAVLAGAVFREPVRARWLPTLGVVAGTWLLVLGTPGR